jgi:hypothetical protein
MLTAVSCDEVNTLSAYAYLRRWASGIAEGHIRAQELTKGLTMFISLPTNKVIRADPSASCFLIPIAAFRPKLVRLLNMI